MATPKQIPRWYCQQSASQTPLELYVYLFKTKQTNFFVFLDSFRVGGRPAMAEHNKDLRSLPDPLRCSSDRNDRIHLVNNNGICMCRAVRPLFRIESLVHARHSGGNGANGTLHNCVRFDSDESRYWASGWTAIGWIAERFNQQLVAGFLAGRFVDRRFWDFGRFCAVCAEHEDFW